MSEKVLELSNKIWIRKEEWDFMQQRIKKQQEEWYKFITKNKENENNNKTQEEN